jgi:hypothetical protein
MSMPRQIPMRVMRRDRIITSALYDAWLMRALLVDVMTFPQRCIHAAMRRRDFSIGWYLTQRTRSRQVAFAHRSPI